MNRESTAEMNNSFIISLVNLVEDTLKKKRVHTIQKCTKGLNQPDKTKNQAVKKSPMALSMRVTWKG
jgi:hypothetical protein